MKRLGTTPDGLSQTEVQNRLSKYGYNELAEKRISPFLKFLSYFKGPIPGMIIAAAVISGLLHHWPDLGVILGLLFMNAIVGFREEYQADTTIAALKEKLAVEAKVKRGGNWTVVPARELVPGDIIRLRIGGIIPADAKLLEGDPIQVDQSALTGESLPVEHKSGDVVYSGSIVKQGEIDALVYATGQSTYYGKTAELVESAKTQSHLQRAVLKIADYLIFIAMVLAAIVIAVAIHRGDQLLTVLRFALILTVAAVPVAMPAVLSVTMALGARVLAKMKAIVTHLPAVEELAGIDVLCSDKTGTLTKAELTLGEPFTQDSINQSEIIIAAALASRAEDQDPIDLAVLDGIKDKKILGQYHVVHFQPFDPVHKRTEALVKGKGEAEFKVSKGAPQVIMTLDPKANQFESEVDKAITEFATRGYRSLGVAKTDTQGKWHFLGILPLYDPPRDDSKATIYSSKEMGLNVKMVTGDQIAIAKEIGRQLDLGTNIMDATIFGDVKHHESGQVANTIEKADGFAQVFPEHKYHIVDVMQQHGHIVGMTGDGVNDAPALKKADAGIAVSGATDAARSAADIVLLVPGLSVIVDAIKESRKIFQRMINYATYRIAETIALLGFLAIAILAFKVYPVTAIMIVLLAILNDFAIISIAYDNTRYSNKPETWNMRLVMGVAIALGIFAMFRSFGIFYLGDRLFHLDPGTLRTLVYLNLSVGGHLTVFAARTRGAFWSIRPSRVLLGAVFGTQAAATLIAVKGVFMSPITWQMAGIVWGYCAVLFLFQDRVKLLAHRIFGQKHSGLLSQM
ncbi:MAG: plasma-membrane proton-efflux P-type ATPase [Dehalococcoidia bacterium]|nr:MAG: plasma-membrane proton-efflux P-type ATPase [Dehalococcoidia bacterium]